MTNTAGNPLANRIPLTFELDIETVDLNDAELLKLAKKTFVLITIIGPYILHGEHAFKACAEAGTHYLDCTGEAPWANKMIKQYEATARSTGAIMIPSCGMNTSPSDVLTWSMAQMIKSKLSAQVGDVVVEIHELS